MTNLLILGGTTEASALAAECAAGGIAATLSYAGRTAAPARQPVAVRVGGFGGVAGLAAYMRDQRVTHVVDATHPFAARISANAVAAAEAIGVPLIALGRPAWAAREGDRWTRVADIAGAVAALGGPARRVMLALGRMHVEAFAAQPQHHYLLRFVDRPPIPPALPHHALVVDRGPFTLVGDGRLMKANGIDLVVAKNAGGSGAVAKIDAARALGLPVLMIDRPAIPERPEVHDVAAVLRWLHHDAWRGV
ncbi:precorrin-6A reductase [Sphingomonas gellani]|uniref:Precorrin-6A reductase n=1 Tax=Sphingomonas gellani TaxID=1166340 RepID=A0A1H8CT39_9SPHN|nr:cobalt-precorrin-6A reductase [Sphingomonas gellani]SEM98039.1 precorrin-6A reductase [Sphingomonas gellani]